jgi:hypothetical protein
MPYVSTWNNWEPPGIEIQIDSILRQLEMIYNLQITAYPQPEYQMTLYRIRDNLRTNQIREIGVTATEGISDAQTIDRIHQACLSLRDSTQAECPQFPGTTNEYESIEDMIKHKPSEKEMKDIKTEVKKTIKTLLFSTRAGTNNGMMIPTDSVIYQLKLNKFRPENDLIICPEDLFRITGGITIVNDIYTVQEEDWERPHAVNINFKIEDNEVITEAFDESLSEQTTFALKDFATMIKDVTKKPTKVIMRDKIAENTAYKNKRKEIKRKIKNENPGVNQYTLREAINRDICNWENKIYKTLMEV